MPEMYVKIYRDIDIFLSIIHLISSLYIKQFR